MMKQTGTRKESHFQSKAIELIKNLGGYVIKIHVSAYESQGEPDLVVCYLGKFIAFELKVDGNTTSKLQEYKINKIQQAGGIAKAVYCLKDIEDTLYEIFRIQQGDKSQ